jgi:transcriptional regulator with XRE-family HTH domain
MEHANQIWGRRLRESRTKSGLLQQALGIAAGLNQFVASTRINRYELGVQKADFLIAIRLAEVLNVPAAYFYAEDDQLAELLIAFHRTGTRKRALILNASKD